MQLSRNTCRRADLFPLNYYSRTISSVMKRSRILSASIRKQVEGRNRVTFPDLFSKCNVRKLICICRSS